MSIKNSSDTIGNRTRDLLACSIVPQSTASSAAFQFEGRRKNYVYDTVNYTKHIISEYFFSDLVYIISVP
jgi:hypothetical protein